MRPRLTLLCAAVAIAAALPVAEAQEKVTISEAGVALFRLPVDVALAIGADKAEGLDVQVVETRTGSDGIKMLVGDAVDFDVGQLIDAAQVYNQGLPVHGVAMLTNRMSNTVTVRKDLATEIKSLHDLKGRPFGITGVGSGTWQFVLFLGAQEGMKPEDFNFIGVGTNANILGAMRSKHVDAVSYSDPEALELVTEGDAVWLVDMPDPATHEHWIGKEYLNNWLMVEPGYAQTHGKAVQGVVNALQRALNWTNTHRAEEVAALLERQPQFAGFDPKYLLGTYRRLGVPKTAEVTQAAFDAAMRIPVTAGVLPKPVPFDALVDNSFAAAAAKAYPPP